jgi:co-chaperonin GroES (HSP10)
MTANSDLKPVRDFLVKLPKKFKDTFTMAGQEFYLENKFREFENRYCYGEVVGVPEKHDTPVKVGDTLYFHHHVVLDKRAEIEKDIYLVRYSEHGGHATQAYAYKRDGVIRLFSDWVFVHIEKKKEDKTSSGIILLPEAVKKNVATVAYDSDTLEHYGIAKGDTVVFARDADYEMELDGDTVYRMRIDDILYVEKA